MAVSDATLVGRVLAGDAESFRPLVERYQDAVFGVALSVTGSAADAEDVAQETFVRAHQSLDTLRKPDSFGSWLCQIARSTSRRHLRGDARRRKRHAALAGSRGTAPGPDELAAHRELRGQVMDALCRLSQAIREAATLFYIDGYTTTDISRFTGRPVGTVKRRLHDARKQLRKELVAMLGDELKRSRPGKEFAAKVLATIERVRVWQGGPEGETTLMLIDSEGRAYTSPIGGYEAEVVQRSVAGEKSAQPPELHAALLQILAQFGRTIERVKLACAPAPNLKATVTLKADAGPRTVVDVSLKTNWPTSGRAAAPTANRCRRRPHGARCRKAGGRCSRPSRSRWKHSNGTRTASWPAGRSPRPSPAPATRHPW
jgi:RNA polymerase sigma-70 factor (ECF subfamily)